MRKSEINKFREYFSSLASDGEISVFSSDGIKLFNVELSDDSLLVRIFFQCLREIEIPLIYVDLSSLEEVVLALSTDFGHLSLDIDYASSDELAEADFLNEKDLLLEEALITELNCLFNKVHKEVLF